MENSFNIEQIKCFIVNDKYIDIWNCPRNELLDINDEKSLKVISFRKSKFTKEDLWLITFEKVLYGYTLLKVYNIFNKKEIFTFSKGVNTNWLRVFDTLEFNEILRLDEFKNILQNENKGMLETFISELDNLILEVIKGKQKLSLDE